MDYRRVRALRYRVIPIRVEKIANRSGAREKGGGGQIEKDDDDPYRVIVIHGGGGDET